MDRNKQDSLAVDDIPTSSFTTLEQGRLSASLAAEMKDYHPRPSRMLAKDWRPVEGRRSARLGDLGGHAFRAQSPAPGTLAGPSSGHMVEAQDLQSPDAHPGRRQAR